MINYTEIRKDVIRFHNTKKPNDIDKCIDLSNIFKLNSDELLRSLLLLSNRDLLALINFSKYVKELIDSHIVYSESEAYINLTATVKYMKTKNHRRRKPSRPSMENQELIEFASRNYSIGYIDINYAKGRIVGKVKIEGYITIDRKRSVRLINPELIDIIKK